MHTQEIANAMDLSFSEEMEELPAPIPLPQRNTRRRELSSSPELHSGKTPVKRNKTGPKHPAKNQPLASTGSTVGTPLASKAPNQVGQTASPTGDAPTEQPAGHTAECTATAEVEDVSTPAAAAPTGTECYNDLTCDHRGRSMTPAATQTYFVPRLASFAPNQRQSWTLPEVQSDEDVLVLTDSNGRTLSHRSPPNWRIASYRGGKLQDVIKLLQHGSVPRDPQLTATPGGATQHPVFPGTTTGRS